MNRLLFAIAFLLGAIAVVWMGSSFIDSDKLALTVTVAIGCVYTIGFVELLQFRQATSTLSSALRALPATALAGTSVLDDWLKKLHPSLQNAVRLRIEGERVGLPAPVITPYLVGLLVMLGLLGTFVGMVETLKGAVFALEGTTELQAIRAGLAAPINGLSMAFGTSVAGVATSALLGLVSTLSRRERMLATRQLDNNAATVFRDFSLSHNRQETYKALQSQAQALPDVAEKLNALAQKLERMGDTLGDKLIANQNQFHEAVTSVYTELASSVDRSLKQSLAESGRLAGESIKPLVQEAMTGIGKEAQNTHRQLTITAQEQLQALSGAWQEGLGAHQRSNEVLIAGMSTSFESFNTQFEQTSASMLLQQAAGDKERLGHWTDSLGQVQEQAVTQLADASRVFTGELQQLGNAQQVSLKTVTQDFESMSGALTAQWQQAGEQMDTLTSTLGTQLTTLRHEEELRGQAAAERMAGLEETVAGHLATLGKELEEPMTRLIQTASETPRAAAEVIGHLRREISNNIERDNTLLEERRGIMEQLNTLSGSLEQASVGQREAIEELVKSSAGLLQEVGTAFTDQVGSELTKMSGVAENFAGSATHMSSLGDAFSLAVNLFNESNGNLIEHLARIEESMDKSTSRSDEQMGYYVAQAREIIDQSMLSQKEVFEELQQLGQRQDLIAAEAS